MVRFPPRVGCRPDNAPTLPGGFWSLIVLAPANHTTFGDVAERAGHWRFPVPFGFFSERGGGPSTGTFHSKQVARCVRPKERLVALVRPHGNPRATPLRALVL